LVLFLSFLLPNTVSALLLWLFSFMEFNGENFYSAILPLSLHTCFNDYHCSNSYAGVLSQWVRFLHVGLDSKYICISNFKRNFKQVLWVYMHPKWNKFIFIHQKCMDEPIFP
jgi:hypothetical protein